MLAALETLESCVSREVMDLHGELRSSTGLFLRPRLPDAVAAHLCLSCAGISPGSKPYARGILPYACRMFCGLLLSPGRPAMTRCEDRRFAAIVRTVFPTPETYRLPDGDKLSQEQANCHRHAVIFHAPVVPCGARTRSPTRQQHTACPGIPLALARGAYGMERRTDGQPTHRRYHYASL